MIQPTRLTANITAKALTISGLTANNKIIDGNTNATLSGIPILNGVVGSDNVAIGGTPVATFASSAAGSDIAVGVTGYTLTGTAASNYILTQPTGLSAGIFSLSTTREDATFGPVPFTSELNIQLNRAAVSATSVTTVRVFGYDGKLVRTVTAAPKTDKITLSGANLAQGIYLIEISNNQFKQIKRVIKN